MALATALGAALIAAAICFEVLLGPGQIPLARLDRWTGAVTACITLNFTPDPADEKADHPYPLGYGHAIPMDCESRH